MTSSELLFAVLAVDSSFGWRVRGGGNGEAIKIKLIFDAEISLFVFDLPLHLIRGWNRGKCV
jgi:hypothetical protein